LGWGPEFQASVPVIRILAFQQPLVAVDILLGTALLALHQERRWMWAMVAAAIFNPTLNLLVIPMFEHVGQNGALGAALVELATEVIMFAAALYLLPHGMLERTTLRRVGGIVFAGG